VTVGVISGVTPNSKSTGTIPGTIGYRSDAKVLAGNDIGKTYGETFGPGDIIGCGLCFITNEIFFTKNGNQLGKAENIKKVRTALK